MWYFNPRAREEPDNTEYAWAYTRIYFNPRAREEPDVLPDENGYAKIISIHGLAKSPTIKSYETSGV